MQMQLGCDIKTTLVQRWNPHPCILAKAIAHSVLKLASRPIVRSPLIAKKWSMGSHRSLRVPAPRERQTLSLHTRTACRSRPCWLHSQRSAERPSPEAVSHSFWHHSPSIHALEVCSASVPCTGGIRTRQRPVRCCQISGRNATLSNALCAFASAEKNLWPSVRKCFPGRSFATCAGVAFLHVVDRSSTLFSTISCIFQRCRPP